MLRLRRILHGDVEVEIYPCLGLRRPKNLRFFTDPDLRKGLLEGAGDLVSWL